MTIGNLPEEVLLEIFEHYLRSFLNRYPLSRAVRAWNNKNGWFKLAHVCHTWRIVVLASPSRLNMRLHFSHDTPSRAVVLERFSHLPIIVDYNGTTWKAGALQRFLSALRYPDRVHCITFTQPKKVFDEICKALDSPFPALVVLEVQNAHHEQPIFLPTSFMTSVRSLLYLRLIGARLTSLFPLLSVARALTHLTLSIDTVFCPMAGASLLAHLQHMPRLRSLEVSVRLDLANEHIENPSTTAFLPELTCFRFLGGRTETERFVAGLVTPSLRELRILVIDLVAEVSPTGQIANYVSKSIRVAGVIFLAARLSMSLTSPDSPKISLFAYPHSINDPPSKKFTFNMQTAIKLGSALSATLATLEEIFLSGFDHIPFYFPSLFGSWVPWREFFEAFRNVKVLRLHHGLEKEIANILRPPNVNSPPLQGEVGPDAMTASGTPIDSNDSPFTLNIFPSLEEIVVYPRTPNASIGADERASVLESFGLFAIARHQAGHPVRVSWNIDGRIPRYGIP